MTALLPVVLAISAAARTADAATPALDDAIAQANVRLVEMQRSFFIPGMQIAVLQDGDTVWSAAFGVRDIERQLPVAENTRFGIGSITKTLTMVTTARLVETGHIDWDEPVATYLEDYPRPAAGVTVRRIGAHLSGMGEVELAAAWDARSIGAGWRRIAGAPALDEPGAKHHYATWPFAIIAAVIESVEGAAFADVVTRELTGPLELRGTVPDDPNEELPDRTDFHELRAGKPSPVRSDPGGRIGGTGYLSTALDLARMGHAVILTDFLRDETRAELLRDHRTADGQPTFFGLGWRLGRSEEWGSFYGASGGGDGIAAALLVIPRFGLCVATVTNLTRAPAWAMTSETAGIFAGTVEPVDAR